MELFADELQIPTVYFARKILAGSELLDNGAIRVEDGVITHIGPKSGIRQQGDRIVNLGDMTLVPGFINLYAQIEESPFRSLLDYTQKSPFFFRQEVEKKLSELTKCDNSALDRSIGLTLRESLSNGITTTVSSSYYASDESFSFTPGELITLVDSKHLSGVTQFSFARKIADKIHNRSSSNGFAAPALYSHHPRFLKEAQRILDRNRFHFQMILNESPDELSAFGDHRGDLFDSITAEKSWYFTEEKSSPARIAITNSLIPRHSAVIHPNYCGSDELVAFQSLSATAVISPRFAQFFDLRPFPFANALDNRLSIAVSTGSPALVPSMNLLDELYEIRKEHPSIPAIELLDMITRNPAKALRMDKFVGTLEIGKRANITGIRSNALSNSPLDDLIQGEISVEFVLVRGEELIVP